MDDVQYPAVIDVVRQSLPAREGMRIARDRAELRGENDRHFVEGHADTPKCFTDAQWHSWKAAARMSRPSGLHTYCEDCTPSYRDRMLVQGRCHFPNTTFVGTYGFRIFWVKNIDGRKRERRPRVR